MIAIYRERRTSHGSQDTLREKLIDYWKLEIAQRSLMQVFGLKASNRILQKANLVRFPKSSNQIVSPNKKTVAVLWDKCEVIALVQFIALFGELKDGVWPTFCGQHEYWRTNCRNKLPKIQ